jgi:hypothetical protein
MAAIGDRRRWLSIRDREKLSVLEEGGARVSDVDSDHNHGDPRRSRRPKLGCFYDSKL